MTDTAQIAEAYDAARELEWERLVHDALGEIEFALTTDLLARHIDSAAAVVDIGSGPGRYAEHLLRRGCRVGLVDLSAKSLERFHTWTGGAYAEQVLFTRVGCATQLDDLAAETFDAALLMGPLYHLTTAAERRAAVAAVRRLLKPGGHVIASFISPYPRLRRLLEADGRRLQDGSYIAALVAGGTTHTTAPGTVVPQHRCWPHEARALMEEGGFHTLCMRNLEGIAHALTESEQRLLADDGRRAAYYAVLRETCENPDLLGATIHFAYGMPQQ
ncbi:MAG: methyltransferase domain-containing protein [Candidatus Latescibacterota bacterium]